MLRFWLSARSVSNGDLQPADADGWVTLANGTYVFAFGISDAPLESINIITDAAIAFSSLTIEDTNAPSEGAGACTDHDNSADSTWTQENPSTAYVATSGTGWGGAALALTKTAGKGSAMVHLGNMGAARVRVKVVVTTGGKVRMIPFGKA